MTTLVSDTATAELEVSINEAVALYAGMSKRNTVAFLATQPYVKVTSHKVSTDEAGVVNTDARFGCFFGVPETTHVDTINRMFAEEFILEAIKSVTETKKTSDGNTVTSTGWVKS